MPYTNEDLPFVSGSSTSEKAAESMGASAPTDRARVLELLRNHIGLTDEMMQEKLGMNPSTQRPRRIELVKAGLVVDSGFKNPTRSGRDATVWRAK